jgi:hypothetical protein
MRMRHEFGADAGSGGRPAPHVYASADGDVLALRDEQLGKIFRNMRLTLKVSRETVARRLATSTACIDNFEAGAVGALPHGKETERIVRGYCELLRIDPEPILWRISTVLQVVSNQPERRTRKGRASRTNGSGQPQVRSHSARSERTARQSPRQRRSRRALFAVSAPVALLAGLVYMAHAAPQPVYRAVAMLPKPIDSYARTGLDYVALLTATRREGLYWIEVSDPRLRKADRLQSSTR